MLPSFGVLPLSWLLGEFTTLNSIVSPDATTLREAGMFDVQIAMMARDKAYSVAQEEETYAIFAEYGLTRERVRPLVQGFKQDREMWVKVR